MCMSPIIIAFLLLSNMYNYDKKFQLLLGKTRYSLYSFCCIGRPRSTIFILSERAYLYAISY